MRDEHDQRRRDPVVQHQEAGRFKQSARSADVDGSPIRGWTTGSSTFTNAVDENAACRTPSTAPASHPAYPSAEKIARYPSANDNPKKKCNTYPSALARFRSPVTIVPSRNGRATRGMRRSIAARRIVVSTSVPTKPPTNAPQTLTEPHRLGRSRPPRLATRDA